MGGACNLKFCGDSVFVELEVVLDGIRGWVLVNDDSPLSKLPMAVL